MKVMRRYVHTLKKVKGSLRFAGRNREADMSIDGWCGCGDVEASPEAQMLLHDVRAAQPLETRAGS